MPELIDTFLVTLFAMAVIIGLAPVALVLYGSTRWSEVSLAFNRARRIRLTDIFDQASRHGEIPQARTLNIVQRYFDIDDDIAWAKEVLKPKKDEFDESDFILARKMVDAVLQSTLNDPDQSREGSEDAVKGAIPPVRRHRRPHRSTGSNSAR